MRKNDLIKLLESVPGNPDIRINYPPSPCYTEDAIWAVTGDSDQIDIWAAHLNAMLLGFSQTREDHTILYES